MKPFISIVTVAYNSELTIRATIESVLNQSFCNFEYTIVDGLSKDSTLAIAEEYRSKFASKGISYKIISEKDKGIYDAMNKGIKASIGDIVGLINSDDYYELNALEEVANFYEQKNFDIMYADLRIFDNKKEFIKKSKYTKKFSTRYWNHPTTFVAKIVYEQKLYACESIYDDLDFMLNAREKKLNIAILNKILANFRLGGVSTKKSLKKTFEKIKLRNSIYKKNNCKGYRLNNFVIEIAKFILA